MSSNGLKQKNSGGVNQQAQNNGVNQSAGRDNYNNCNIIFSKEKDFGILSEIFDYIFSAKINGNKSDLIQDSGRFTRLKDKLSLNFEEEEKKEVGETITRCWDKIEIVERYVQENQQLSSERIDSLVILIKSLFRQKSGTVSCDNKIERMQVFEDIAKTFIPESKINNSDYYSNALSIVLYFFQMCEIGKKLPLENKSKNHFE